MIHSGSPVNHGDAKRRSEVIIALGAIDGEQTRVAEGLYTHVGVTQFRDESNCLTRYVRSVLCTGPGAKYADVSQIPSSCGHCSTCIGACGGAVVQFT